MTLMLREHGSGHQATRGYVDYIYIIVCILSLFLKVFCVFLIHKLSGGDCADLSYWVDGEPNNSGGVQHCAKIYSGSTRTVGSMMDDDGCSESKYFVCDSTPTMVPTAYMVIYDQMSWSDGNNYCAAQYGTSLATITNDEDAQILLDLATAGTDAWIGLNEMNGEWVWASGYPWFVST